MKALLKKAMSTTLLVAIVTPLIALTSSNPLMASETNVNVRRIAGVSRYETSAKLSREFGTPGGDVIIASGEHFSDALAAAPLSADINAPILLTTSKQLPNYTVNEINRLNPRKSYVVGSYASLSKNQETSLNNPSRIAGANDSDTVMKINEVRSSLKPLQGEGIYNVGLYPDALVSGPLASKMNIKLTPMERAGNVKYVFGGPVSVPYSGSGKRFAGSSRYDTAEMIAREYVNQYGKVNTVIIASGENYPDALSSTLAASAKNAPILLVKKNEIPTGVRNFIKENNVREIIIVGGESSVSQNVYNEFTNIYKEAAPTPKPVEQTKEKPNNASAVTGDFKTNFNSGKVYDLNKVEQEVLVLVNNLRRSKGVKPLTISKLNAKGTLIRASEMAEYGNLRVKGKSHTRPNGQPSETAFDILPDSKAENILQFPINLREKGMHFNSTHIKDEKALAKFIFDNWCESPGHLKNMISPHYETMNIAVQINYAESGVEPRYKNRKGYYSLIAVQTFDLYNDAEMVKRNK